MKKIKTILIVIFALVFPIVLIHYSRSIDAKEGECVVLACVGLLGEIAAIYLFFKNENIEF